MFTNNLVFIPKRFSTEKCGFIEGFHRKKPNFDVYYITHPEVHTTCKNQLGYVGKHPNVEFPGKNTLFITQGTKNIHLDKENNEDIHVTQIRYEYEAFRNSKLVSEGDKIYGILLGELAEKISESRAIVNENNTGVFYWFFALLNIIIKFRIITLVIHTLFSKLKDSISSIPLYIVILWIFKSSSIAGTLHMQLIESSNSNNVIEITLAPLSLTESIEKFSSTVKDNNTQINHSLSTIISRLLIGQLV
ncbi:hypothetical protein D910_07981 [Dendroctonus ponderosae]